MKKVWITAVVVMVALVALGAAGLAYAQSNTPQPQDGTGMMFGGRGQGQHGPGMMGYASAGAYGPMHEYMQAALAEALGFDTVEEFQAAIDAGATPWTIAQEQGLTEEETQALLLDARTSALEAAVADGVITQEQADFMLERMSQMQANGLGQGPCRGGTSGPRGGGMRGNGGMGRWQNQQP